MTRKTTSLTRTPRKPARVVARTMAVSVIALGATLLGCASPNPWLAPRGSARLLLDESAARSSARAAPMKSFDVPLPGAVSAGGPSEIAKLDATEARLRRESVDLQDARGRSIALASALGTYQSQPSEHHRQVAEDSIRAYQGSPAVRKFGAIALAFSLAACNSISSQINSLNSEERDLASRLAVVDNARKTNIALVSALQQVQRDGGTSKSKAAAAKARAAYDAALSKL